MFVDESVTFDVQIASPFYSAPQSITLVDQAKTKKPGGAGTATGTAKGADM
jgi:hypothetical protein